MKKTVKDVKKLFLKVPACTMIIKSDKNRKLIAGLSDEATLCYMHITFYIKGSAFAVDVNSKAIQELIAKKIILTTCDAIIFRLNPLIAIKVYC